MMAAPPSPTIRRVLVAVDASPQSLAVLETAAELAERLRAELHGLFIEDINLRRLGDLPIARQVRSLSSTVCSCEGSEIELQIRAQADRARHALEQVARRTHLSWSFRTTPGDVVTQVLEGVLETDLMALGRVGWTPAGRQRKLGSTTRHILARRRGLTLIQETRAKKNLPIVVLFDGSPEAERALAVACQLVEHKDRRLTVLLAGQDREARQALERRLADHNGERNLKTTFEDLPEVQATALQRALCSTGESLLVLAAESPALPPDSLPEILTSLSCPVLVVR